jgi:hypothetical protein
MKISHEKVSTTLSESGTGKTESGMKKVESSVSRWNNYPSTEIPFHD